MQIVTLVSAVVGLLRMGGMTHADEIYYKWQDDKGQWHYANAANPSAVKMFDLSGVESPAVEAKPPTTAGSGASAAIARYKLRQEARRVLREIREINGFFEEVRARELERFDSYSVREILSDLQIADLATELRGRRADLFAELERLEAEEQELAGDDRGHMARLAPLRQALPGW
jgi:hypothetical protein